MVRSLLKKTLQVQLNAKNKEFETAQAEFKSLTEQYQKEKNETIQAKANEYTAGLRVLQEQLKAKDENIKQQINVATAEMRAKLEVASSENNRLSRIERELDSLNSNKKWYIIAGIIIGIIVAMLLLK